jgi:hypothetical protein
MTEPLPPAGYAADVPHPPIGVSIDVPDHWTVLDLNPQTWDVWLDAFLDQRLAGRPDANRERGPARKALVDLLRQLHGEKVFMATILAADVGGELVSASATLAWRKLDVGEEGIPVAGLREVYARASASPGENLAARRVETVQLPAGGAVKVATKETVRVPMMNQIQPVNVTQYFVPVLHTDWLAVITTTTGNPALAPGTEAVADGMAASLAFTASPAAPA